MRKSIEDADKINMLSPIDNVFGRHEGRNSPTLLYLAVVSIPFLIYIFYFMWLIPLKYMLVIEVLWAARMALKILGNESLRVVEYVADRQNEYQSSTKLIRIGHVYDNGIVEYENGQVKVFVTGFAASYTDDDAFSVDMEKFLTAISKWETDVYMHMFVDEFSLQNESEALRVYTDKNWMRERMEFYQLQDEWTSGNCSMFRYTFVVKFFKSDWKNTLQEITDICSSSISNVFFMIGIAGHDEVSEICSRDIGTYVNLQKMLQEKYSNDTFHGSKVLYYGDTPQDDLLENESIDSLSSRRVLYELDEDGDDYK